nr:uncharacterized protein LOC115264508 [Aedes albopictus]
MNKEYYRIRHGSAEQATLASVSISRGRSQQRFSRAPPNLGRFGNHQPRCWDELGARRPGTSAWKTPGEERCFRCNSMFHKPSDCGAIDQTCLKCGRKGHFKRTCQTLIRMGSKQQSESDNSGIESKRIAMVDMEENTKEEERPTEAEVGDKKY